MGKPVLLVVGVGAATGQSLCRQVAGRYQLVMVARSSTLIRSLAAELPDAHAYECDIADRTAWGETLRQITADVALPRYILINTESAAWGHYSELSLAKFAASFDVNAVSLLQTVQTLFPDPAQVPRGSRLMLSSSPAAYNPPPDFLGLAPSRVAQRVMAELLNSILAPSGLAFSVFSIDGAIDEPNMRAMMPDKPTSWFIQPQEIAAEMARLFEAEDFPIKSGISGASAFGKR